MKWALRSARFPADNHTDRILSYPSEDGLNFNGIDAPTPIDQIKKLEKQNEIAINVFDYESPKVFVCEGHRKSGAFHHIVC